jgi:hypothetical protein
MPPRWTSPLGQLRLAAAVARSVGDLPLCAVELGHPRRRHDPRGRWTRGRRRRAAPRGLRHRRRGRRRQDRCGRAGSWRSSACSSGTNRANVWLDEALETLYDTRWTAFSRGQSLRAETALECGDRTSRAKLLEHAWVLATESRDHCWLDGDARTGSPRRRAGRASVGRASAPAKTNFLDTADKPSSEDCSGWWNADAG